MSSSGSVQHLARALEQQISRNPFIPKPALLFSRSSSRSVRRSTSSPHLPSQISQTSEIRAASKVQTLTPSPPLPAPSGQSSSPFSVSGTFDLYFDRIYDWL